MSDESVFVYLPLKFDSENTTSLEESLQRIDNDDEPKSIAVNTLAVNYSYQNWRRWTFEDFQPLHDGQFFCFFFISFLYLFLHLKLVFALC